jgi:hypothetical protein
MELSHEPQHDPCSAARPDRRLLMGQSDGHFFAQVEREQDDDDPREPLLLWRGTGQGESRRAEDLVEPLAPYANRTATDLAMLRADRVADADRGPTPLQRTRPDLLRDRSDQA